MGRRRRSRAWNTLGTYVERLRELLDRSTADEAFRGRVEWLR